jgi:hypothetical protein
VYVSRLHSTLSVFVSLAPSLSLSLVFLRVAERKRLGAKAQCVPKATTTPKGQRVQIIIRYKGVVGWGGGGRERGVPNSVLIGYLPTTLFLIRRFWKRNFPFCFFPWGQQPTT